MRPLPVSLVSAGMVFFGCLVWTVPAQAQDDGGDRFLDGIGETALIARYVFDGNGKDSSRNNDHATLHGTAATYVKDRQFGSVLSLPGKSGGYVEIPGHVLIDVDTISVTGWVFVRSAAPWQRFFDFGQDTTANCFCTPIGADADEGYRARITSKGQTEEQGPLAPRIETNRWVHLAVVLDAAKQTLSTYASGVRIGRATNVTLNLEQVLDQDNAAANRLYIGKSQYNTDSDINAKIHDFRIYSIALSDRQVANIHRNALSDRDVVTSGEETPGESTPPEATGAVTMPDAFGLVKVPDISAETIVGHLPRLPHTIGGVYRNDAKGPKVRVIWPRPMTTVKSLNRALIR